VRSKGKATGGTFAPYVRAFAQQAKVMESGAASPDGGEEVNHLVDIRLVNLHDGYAGTADGIILCEDLFIVYDIKSRDLKPGKPVEYYGEYLEQLGAYAKAYMEMTGFMCAGGCSIVINRTLDGNGESSSDIKFYSSVEMRKGFEIFQAFYTAWKLRRDWK